MNAITTNYGAGFAESAPSPTAASDGDPLAANALGLGLQLSRANAMALTRLQLALCSGERRQALAAIDRLAALDAQLERLVARLEVSPADDADWRALSTHLTDQKLALAFEKLALASGIVGPDLQSSPAYPEEVRSTVSKDHPDEARSTVSKGPQPTATDEPPLVDWTAFPEIQPTVWDRLPPRVWGAVLALALMLAAAVGLMVAGMV